MKPGPSPACWASSHWWALTVSSLKEARAQHLVLIHSWHQPDNGTVEAAFHSPQWLARGTAEP